MTVVDSGPGPAADAIRSAWTEIRQALFEPDAV
jgi:hypothetical protein